MACFNCAERGGKSQHLLQGDASHARVDSRDAATASTPQRNPRPRVFEKTLAMLFLLLSPKSHLAYIAPGYVGPAVRHAQVNMQVSGAKLDTAPTVRVRGPKGKQSLSQNFLVDRGVARRWVKSVGSSAKDGSRVIELGPGQGGLTELLLNRFPEMLALEIDNRMIEYLEETIKLPIRIQQGDLMKLDFPEQALREGGKLSVVSNTPFHLTSPLLFKLLASAEFIEEASLSMQLEVKDKLISPPKCKSYVPLSVMVQLFGNPQPQFDIPPACFQPQPKCWASVVKFQPSPIPRGEDKAMLPEERVALLGLLKYGFEQRRKMLRKSMKKLFSSGLVEPPPEEFLTKRPEELSPEDWLRFARALFGDKLKDGAKTLASVHKVKDWTAHKEGYKDIEYDWEYEDVRQYDDEYDEYEDDPMVGKWKMGMEYDGDISKP